MNQYGQPINGVKFDIQLTPETVKTLYTLVGVFAASLIIAAIIRRNG
jgi:hypothetical protein